MARGGSDEADNLLRPSYERKRFEGRFVTREEGLEIARAAGQVDKIIGGVLTSEDLY